MTYISSILLIKPPSELSLPAPPSHFTAFSAAPSHSRSRISCLFGIIFQMNNSPIRVNPHSFRTAPRSSSGTNPTTSPTSTSPSTRIPAPTTTAANSSRNNYSPKYRPLIPPSAVFSLIASNSAISFPPICAKSKKHSKCTSTLMQNQGFSLSKAEGSGNQKRNLRQQPQGGQRKGSARSAGRKDAEGN